MESHGVPRQPLVPKSDAAKAEERQKIKRYRARVDRVNEALERATHTRQSLDLTSELLSENPEYYTIWNYRRRILKSLLVEESRSLPEGTSPSVIRKNLLATDLKFLIPLLVGWPKCYWIWNHRIWLLQQATILLDPSESLDFWNDELGLVSKMLARDSRNFHGWSYRRLVADEIEKLNPLALVTQRNVGISHSDGGKSEKLSIIESEFAYTTKMIHNNLSNFSAWHRRSKLIAPLLDQRQATTQERRNFFDGELALIWNALFDPADQSLWFYHQYLMSVILSSDDNETAVKLKLTQEERKTYLREEMVKLRELLEDVDDCKWIYQSLLECGTQLVNLSDKDQGLSSVEAANWLSKLKILDPLRIERWNELGTRLRLD